jgi:hypothetical protein
MNNAAATDSVTHQFAVAVRDFTPKASAKFRKLLPFKDGVAELRRKGASYATITDILRNMNVAVSHDTVARFCHEVLGVALVERRRRKPRARDVSRKPSNPPHSPSITDPSMRGPRVADSNNISPSGQKIHPAIPVLQH